MHYSTKTQHNINFTNNDINILPYGDIICLDLSDFNYNNNDEYTLIKKCNNLEKLVLPKNIIYDNITVHVPSNYDNIYKEILSSNNNKYNCHDFDIDNYIETNKMSSKSDKGLTLTKIIYNCSNYDDENKYDNVINLINHYRNNNCLKCNTTEIKNCCLDDSFNDLKNDNLQYKYINVGNHISDNIKIYRYTYPRFKDFDFSILEKCTKLKEININGYNIFNKYNGVYDIDNIQLTNSLEAIDLSYNNLELSDNINMNQSKTIMKLFSKFNNISTLNLSNNNITYLYSDIFEFMPNLVNLDLSHNNISNINADTFMNNTMLEYISLSNNKLTYIHNSTFSNTINLKTLSLSNNKLKYLDDVVFSNLSSLNKLYLSYNRLYKLHDNIFKNTKELTHLYLSHNKITNLPLSLFNCDKLVTFSLRNNYIKSLDNKLFNIKSLHNINIKKTPIRNIPDNMIEQHNLVVVR